MAREIDRDDGVETLQRIDLCIPVVGVRGPTVDEHDGGLASPVHVIFDVDTVGSQGDLRASVGDCRRG